MRCFYSLILFFLTTALHGQFPATTDSTGKIHYSVQVQAIATSNHQVPFWMRTNLHGATPSQGVSGSLLGRIERGYSFTRYKKLFDWGFGLEGRGNAADSSGAILTEAYVKGRLSIFELKVGRNKDIAGLVDTALSSGAFSVSGNAPGIPQIKLSVPQYWDLPFTQGILAVKGSLVHGWFGNVQLKHEKSQNYSFYHEFSFYGRIGKPTWKFKVYGGINHLAIWGNEGTLYGTNRYDLNNLQTWPYILTGRAYKNSPTGTAKIGNHLGSVDQGISYDFKTFNLSVYHQFYYDVGGLYHLSNLKDGLFTSVATNNNIASLKGFIWKKILLEYMASKSQGGELDAKPSKSGDEDYYNNYLYYGWAYKGENIGSNFFTNKKYARTNLPQAKNEYIINSRIYLIHVGLEWLVNDISFTTKLSFSKNYGTYGTSPIGHSTGITHTPPPPPYFNMVKQFSGYIGADKPLKNGYQLGVAIATDKGDLLYNSMSGFIRLTKTW